MSNEILGHVTCPFCLSQAKVKRNRNGNLYYHDPVCGPVNNHGDAFPDWIEDNMIPISQEPEPVAASKPDPVPADDHIEPMETEIEEPEPVRTAEPKPTPVQPKSEAGLLL